MERWMVRSLGTIVLACAGSAVPSPAIACICVSDTSTLVWAKGRVFVDGPSGPEAAPDATVELHTDDAKGTKLSVTTTDADGMFELTTPPPGTWRLVVLLYPPNPDCPCGDACVSKPDRSGTVVPKCLEQR